MRTVCITVVIWIHLWIIYLIRTTWKHNVPFISLTENTPLPLKIKWLFPYQLTSLSPNLYHKNAFASCVCACNQQVFKLFSKIPDLYTLACRSQNTGFHINIAYIKTMEQTSYCTLPLVNQNENNIIIIKYIYISMHIHHHANMEVSNQSHQG